MMQFLINMLGIRHSLMHDLLFPDIAFVFFTSYLLYFSSRVFPLNTSLFGTLLPDDSGQHCVGTSGVPRRRHMIA